MGSVHSSATSRRWAKAERQSAESSRVLFLLYLIHRTWNVLVEHVETKSARWRGSHTVPSSGEALGRAGRGGRGYDCASLGGSESCSCCSSCACSYCRRHDCARDSIR